MEYQLMKTFWMQKNKDVYQTCVCLTIVQKMQTFHLFVHTLTVHLMLIDKRNNYRWLFSPNDWACTYPVTFKNPPHGFPGVWYRVPEHLYGRRVVVNAFYVLWCGHRHCNKNWLWWLTVSCLLLFYFFLNLCPRTFALEFLNRTRLLWEFSPYLQHFKMW